MKSFVDNKIKKQIKDHFNTVYPKEGCGLIVLRKGKQFWIPIENIAKDDDHFLMPTGTLTQISYNYDILAVVHNHIHTDNQPSEVDIRCCKATNLPYVIYSYPSMEENIVFYGSERLIGRKYEFGKQDCFELARDYYATLGIFLPFRDPDWQDNWWEDGDNYFSAQYLRNWGFEPTAVLEEGTLLTFETQDDGFPDHCGIYIRNDTFIHHAIHRLSCRENLYPFWKKFLVGKYKYVA